MPALNKKIRKKDIPALNYGVVHSLHAHADGVSIVMSQIEEVMQQEMKIPKQQIYYLVGKTQKSSRNIKTNQLFWHKNPTNKYMNLYFQKGYSEKKIEQVEKHITKTKELIADFIQKNKIDVLIVHNSCHPVNFIYSLALSRYYKEMHDAKKKTPKYILWWHDSFLERERYKNPHDIVENYLYEGVPGKYVDYILFINSLQYKGAQQYFHQLEKKHEDLQPFIEYNHDIIYNTTNLYVETYDDLHTAKNTELVDSFLEEFSVFDALKEKGVTFDETMFCLQHTRIVRRKRIDFAIEYCFSLLYHMRKKGVAKALYFLVSGNSGDEFDSTRKKLELLHAELSRKYEIDTFFLVFAEDHDKITIPFEEYPRIFAKLGGFATYFSEIEGFGNNLLEVLASGLIPVVYTYPVFISDIKKYNFKTIPLNHFVIDFDSQLELMSLMKNQRKRKIWVNKNLTILKKAFPHKIIKQKLTRAIIRRRPVRTKTHKPDLVNS